MTLVTKIAEALLAYCVINIAKIEALWLLRIKIWGAHFMSIFRNSWMDCGDALYAVLCLYCCVMDKT